MQEQLLVLSSAGEAFLVEVTADWGLEEWRGVCEAEKRGRVRLGLPKHPMQSPGVFPSLDLSTEIHKSGVWGRWGN